MTMQLAAAMGRLGTESAFEVLARATRLQREGRDVIAASGRPPIAWTSDSASAPVTTAPARSP